MNWIFWVMWVVSLVALIGIGIAWHMRQRAQSLTGDVVEQMAVIVGLAAAIVLAIAHAVIGAFFLVSRLVS